MKCGKRLFLALLCAMLLLSPVCSQQAQTPITNELLKSIEELENIRLNMNEQKQHLENVETQLEASENALAEMNKAYLQLSQDYKKSLESQQKWKFTCAILIGISIGAVGTTVVIMKRR